MTTMENKQVESIKAQYAPKTANKLDELKALDKKVHRPAQIFAYTFGILGALVLGLGMCLAMKVIGDMMVLGIGVGVLGIVMVSSNYHLYSGYLKSRKQKYAKAVFELSDSILNA